MEKQMNTKTAVWNALKPTPKWAVSFQWSQTESGTALVEAKNAETARKIVKERMPGIHHTTGASKITHEL
jgi:hypothetical protein